MLDWTSSLDIVRCVSSLQGFVRRRSFGAFEMVWFPLARQSGLAPSALAGRAVCGPLIQSTQSRSPRTRSVHVVVAQAGRAKKNSTKSAKAKSAKKQAKAAATVAMPRSRDDAVSQAALALRTHYRNALGAAPKRGISEDVADIGGGVVATYCIVPTNSSELSLSQDIADSMLGSASGTCVFVVDNASSAGDDSDGIVTYDGAMACDADYYVCVAPSTSSIPKLEALVRGLEGSGRRDAPFVVVINPEWGSQLGDGNKCAAIGDTAFCFFPILIKPLMMQALEGVVYRCGFERRVRSLALALALALTRTQALTHSRTNTGRPRAHRTTTSPGRCGRGRSRWVRWPCGRRRTTSRASSTTPLPARTTATAKRRRRAWAVCSGLADDENGVTSAWTYLIDLYSVS